MTMLTTGATMPVLTGPTHARSGCPPGPQRQSVSFGSLGRSPMKAVMISARPSRLVTRNPSTRRSNRERAAARNSEHRAASSGTPAPLAASVTHMAPGFKSPLSQAVLGVEPGGAWRQPEPRVGGPPGALRITLCSGHPPELWSSGSRIAAEGETGGRRRGRRMVDVSGGGAGTAGPTRWSSGA
jgi:hypothetical protein